MIKSFIFIFGISFIVSFSSDISSVALENEELIFERYNPILLQRTVLTLINNKRTAKGLDSLKNNIVLERSAKQFQSKLEFKGFQNSERIESKINRKLTDAVKKSGYSGALAVSIACQHQGINYKKGSEFFHKKNDQGNILGMYYGEKKILKTDYSELDTIPNYTYYEFATALLDGLEKHQKKILFSSAYKDIGIQLSWHYKSLHKRKIPQIKLIAVVGGFMTAGLRE